MKLISTTYFVLNIRDRTTTELCEYLPNVFKAPKWKGSQGEMVKDMLAFDAIKFRGIGEYAKFIKKGLNKGMFIPCDLEGSVLSEPKCQRCYTGTPDDCHSAKECVINEAPFLLYKQAKGRVLFKGFVLTEDECLERIEPDGGIWTIDVDDIVKYTIEDMIQCDLELTESAIKQIGL